ncbi:hypothetical protein G7046_g3394 [Stylonectria norvegica]|nr:hypothetical protein G7046_g3394 [Stylonectria norvegica]
MRDHAAEPNPKQQQQVQPPIGEGAEHNYKRQIQQQNKADALERHRQQQMRQQSEEEALQRQIAREAEIAVAVGEEAVVEPPITANKGAVVELVRESPLDDSSEYPTSEDEDDEEDEPHELGVMEPGPIELGNPVFRNPFGPVHIDSLDALDREATDPNLRAKPRVHAWGWPNPEEGPDNQVPFRTTIGSLIPPAVNPGREVVLRLPSPDLQFFRVHTRCCHILRIKPFKDPVLIGRLGLSDGMEPQHKVGSLFVGWDANSGDPVTLHPMRRNQHEDRISLENDLTGLPVKTVPFRVMTGNHTILHHNLIIPGNFVAQKQYIHLNKRQFPDTPDILGSVQENHQKLLKGEAPYPLLAHRPDKGLYRPVFRSFYNDEEGVDRLFHLYYPPLGAINLPTDFTKEISQFLAKFPEDPMTLQLACGATMVYFDLERAGWTPEGANRKPSKRAPQNTHQMVPSYMVSEVSLATFLIYFPHFLRYAENHKMSRYMHPARFARRHYNQDGAIVGGGMKLEHHLDEALMRRLYGQITMNTPDIQEGARGVSAGVARVHSLCLLDSILTLGLPSYRTTLDTSVALALPKAILKTKVRCSELPTPEIALTTLKDRSWNGEQDAAISVLSGEAAVVGPV